MTAPILYWKAQGLSAHGIFPGLAEFGFESFFHRAILLGALLFLFPFLRWLGIRSLRDLGLQPNECWKRDGVIGFLLSAVPLLGCGGALVFFGVYASRPIIDWPSIASIALTAIVVPFLEEALFRGLFLGVLLRGLRSTAAMLLSAAIFSIVHFLKAPDRTTEVVRWNSGFISLAHSFGQFTEPTMLLASFTTLFLIGWILADSRMRTQSLWLPIGLHSGWIFTSVFFNKIAQRETLALPWLGKSLLIGIVPLGVGLLTWLLVIQWSKYARSCDH